MGTMHLKYVFTSFSVYTPFKVTVYSLENSEEPFGRTKVINCYFVEDLPKLFTVIEHMMPCLKYIQYKKTTVNALV